MDFSRIDARLLSRPGATKALHEKWGWMVYWVGGRQFACEFTTSPDAFHISHPQPSGADAARFLGTIGLGMLELATGGVVSLGFPAVFALAASCCPCLALNSARYC